MNNKIILVAGIILAAILIFAGMNTNYVQYIKTFLPSVEGFSPVPVWDVKQWTWGYGTAAGYDKNEKPLGTITREKAMDELLKIVSNHYTNLNSRITRKLNGKQWAALLSFSYNLGLGNAYKLIPNINSGNYTALYNQWKQYVNAGGTPLQGLMARRNKELQLFQS